MPLMARTFSFVVLAVALCSGQRPPQLIDDPSQVACRVQQLEYAPAPVQAEAWRLPPIEIRCTVPVPTAPPKGGLTYLNRISADIAIEYEGGFKNEPFDCGSTADDVVDAVLFVNSNPGLPSASPSVAKGQDQMAPTPQLGEIDGDRLVFPDVFIPVPGAPVDPENPPAQCAEGEPSPSNPGACFPPETVLRIFNVQLDPEPNIRLKVTVFPEGSTATEERIQIPQVSPDILRITAGSAAAEDIGEQRAVSGAIEVEIRGAKFWMFDAQCGDELSEPQPQRVVVEPSRFWFFTGDLSHLDYRMTVVDTVRGSDGSEWRLSQGHNEDGSGGEPVETDGQTQVEPDENGNGLTMYRRFVVPEDLRDTTPRTEVRIVIPFAITYTPGPLADPPEFRLTVTPADSRPPEITVPKYEPPFARTAEPPGSTKTGSAKTHNANMSLPPFACAKLGLEVQQALTQPAIPSLIEGPMRPCDVRLFANGVVNAASFAPPEVSHGKLSPGSIITLFGQGLGSTEGVELAFPLSAEVNGIRVRVRNGNETVDALPLFSNGAQINAVLTNATPRGPVTIWAEVDGEMSNEVPVEVVDAAVGLFAIEGSYGIVQKADAEFSLVTPDNPVHPGDILIAWGTGAGQTATPSELPPEAEDLGGVRVFLGDVEASRVLYAGPSPCCSGIHQFVFEASQETPGGSYVPLIVETDNGGVSNAVLLDVDDGSVDELNPRKPLAGERLNKGEIRLRSRLRPQPSGAIEAREIIEARSERDRRFDFTPQIDFPPPGTCWFGNRSGNSERDVLQPMPVEPLRPGEITVTAEDGDTVFLSPIFDGVLEWAREIFLASFGPPGLEASLRVGAFIQLLATFAITHDDPDEIADFAEYLLEHLTVPSRIEDLLLPNDKLLAAAKQTPVLISREKSYTVEWTGGDTETDVAYILGFAPGESSVGAFLCSADADAGTFEVPRRALANMPATPADREGFLAVGVVRKLSERTEASVEGLDRLTISEDISIATGARFN